FNLFWKLEGAVFADAGNVWTLKKSDEVSGKEGLFSFKTMGESIAANWGVGLRLNFDFLLIRVDMGMKVHDPAREHKWIGPGQWFKKDGYAIHFGVGYPF
ncbi:MAG: BamA/TamA family outer membrane protein, partial [Bacteroidales bacterium]|nr:BamA/TamA family outer membrane protein [Bacteroidales bacterium]